MQLICANCRRSNVTTERRCIHCDASLLLVQPTEGDPPGLPTLPYFEVGTTKFVVMSLVSLGLYEVFWAYWQWQRLAKRPNADMSPTWRAFFAPYWNFSLFTSIHEDVARAHLDVTWNPTLLAAAYFVLSLCWRLPGAAWLIAYLTFLPMLPVLKSIERLHDAQALDRDRNTGFSTWNVVGMMLGGSLLLLVVVGSFVGDTP